MVSHLRSAALQVKETILVVGAISGYQLFLASSCISSGHMIGLLNGGLQTQKVVLTSPLQTRSYIFFVTFRAGTVCRNPQVGAIYSRACLVKEAHSFKQALSISYLP